MVIALVNKNVIGLTLSLLAILSTSIYWLPVQLTTSQIDRSTTAQPVNNQLHRSTAVASVSMASPDIMVYVDPPEVLDVGISDNFDIYVTASDVVDLFLVEFFMSFDPAVLNVVDDPITNQTIWPPVDGIITGPIEGINPGEVAPYLACIYIEKANNDEGWLHVVAGRPIGVKKGLNGTVQLAKITFLVKAEGSRALHLYDIRLKDLPKDLEHTTIPKDLEHTTKDGYFSTPS